MLDRIEHVQTTLVSQLKLHEETLAVLNGYLDRKGVDEKTLKNIVHTNRNQARAWFGDEAAVSFEERRAWHALFGAFQRFYVMVNLAITKHSDGDVATTQRLRHGELTRAFNELFEATTVMLEEIDAEITKLRRHAELQAYSRRKMTITELNNAMRLVVSHHASARMHLKRYIKSGKIEANELAKLKNPNICEVSEPIHTYAQTHYAEVTEWHDLNVIHREYHELITRIVELHEKGEQAQTQILLECALPSLIDALRTSVANFVEIATADTI